MNELQKDTTNTRTSDREREQNFRLSAYNWREIADGKGTAKRKGKIIASGRNPNRNEMKRKSTTGNASSSRHEENCYPSVAYKQTTRFPQAQQDCSTMVYYVEG